MRSARDEAKTETKVERGLLVNETGRGRGEEQGEAANGEEPVDEKEDKVSAAKTELERAG
jgi:hypothetical protein